MKLSREKKRKRRHLRARQKVCGTPERPRLVARRTSRHIHVQVVDDVQGTVITAATTDVKANSKDRHVNCSNIAFAKQMGEKIAEQAIAKGVEKVVFDCCGGSYHGVLKALADAAREKGLRF